MSKRRPEPPQRAPHQARPRAQTAAGRTPRPTGLWLYGSHAVVAALANARRHCRRLLVTEEAGRQLADTLTALAERRLPVAEPVVRAELDALLPPGAVHQGMALQVEPLTAVTIEDVAGEAKRRERAVVVVLDQVTDPHNVGAVLRSAAAFGALAVIVPDRHAPEETGALAKAASGALERMPLVRVVNVVRALGDLKAAGFWVAGLAADGPQTLAGAGLSGKVALVLGSEGDGLRRLTREHCDLMVRLPMSGDVESLNVSNAAAVSLYELARAD